MIQDIDSGNQKACVLTKNLLGGLFVGIMRLLCGW